jgi:hypothetical protein
MNSANGVKRKHDAGEAAGLLWPRVACAGRFGLLSVRTDPIMRAKRRMPAAAMEGFARLAGVPLVRQLFLRRS